MHTQIHTHTHNMRAILRFNIIKELCASLKVLGNITETQTPISGGLITQQQMARNLLGTRTLHVRNHYCIYLLLFLFQGLEMEMLEYNKIKLSDNIVVKKELMVKIKQILVH